MSRSRSPELPVVARAVLKLSLTPSALESTLGDLEEELALRRRSSGWLRARLWLWNEVFSLSFAYFEERVSSARVARSGSVSPRRERFMDAFVLDARYALRSLRRKPVFSLIVTGTLALGLGATTAFFSVVSGVLLKPLPYPESGRLVVLQETDAADGGRPTSLSPPDFFDWRERTASFESMAAYWSPRVNLTGGGDPEQILAVTCSRDLFDVLRVRAILGRVFGADEDLPGAPRVAVLGYGLWQRRFGGDPLVLGKTLTLDGAPATVVGVMPRGFDFPGAGTELFVPLRLQRERGPVAGRPYRAFRILRVVARLDPDVSLEQASSEIHTVAQGLEREHPETNRGFGGTLDTLHAETVGNARPALLLLLGAVAAVLLIACVNLSSLLLARAATRKKEMAIRLALGARRARLARQILLESLTLSLAGGALGALLSVWGSALLTRLAPEDVPRLSEVRLDGLDGMSAAFALGVSVVVGLGLGLVPAIRALSPDVGTHLRVEGRTTSGDPKGRRTRSLLVVSQIALALVLLVAAGLLLRSFRALSRVDPGFKAESVVSVERIELYRSRYPEPAAWASFFDTLLERIEALPGVESAALTLGLPLGPNAEFYVDASPFHVESRPPENPASPPTAYLHLVSADYFSTLRIPVLEGRSFDARDRDGAPVVIINEAMAERYWPNGDAIGQRLTHELTLVPGAATTREIVGVVRDVHQFGLARDPAPQMYVPHVQMPWPQMHIVVRSTLDATALGSAIRSAVWAIDPNIPVPVVRNMEHVAAASVAEPRFRTMLLAFFAVTGLLLAALGVYGVTAYTVNERTQEMGLRLALGATRRRILTLIVGHALKLATAGLTLGLAGAWGAARLIEGLLFGVSASDPLTFLGVGALLLVVSLAASLVPARRATRVDPLVALRGL